ncbi:Uncharacterized membrane protein YfhO [Eubacterium ruminantium]|nr:Uncharacterized membrane protein YfhO [Eubacterium ruminantium]
MNKQMKFKKINYIHISVLILMYLTMVLLLTRFKFAFGSDPDWTSQHFAIPDNFRREFYNSGKLFPSFLFNIGAGENIYNLSYYGLYSPIILLSYLFPFIPMYLYLQIVSILGVCASIILFYRWTLSKFGSSTAFVLSILFEFSTGLTLHSHRHVMFVSYMPFLLLSFMAVENYFRGRRKYTLVIYTFLCIMCCYYFGVSTVAAITVYGVYEYLRTTDTVTLKDFLKKGSHFAGRILTAVMLSGILLLPTLWCLLRGRDAGNSKLDLNAFIPKVTIDFLCYNPYGMGLTLISVIAVVSSIVSKNKKHTRFLGITIFCLLTLPIFVYVLNGTLYIEPKVLIPFMPLCLLLVGRLFKQLSYKSLSWKLGISVTAFVTADFLLISSNSSLVKKILILDIALAALTMILYQVVKKPFVIQAASVIAAIITGYVLNYFNPMTKQSRLDYLYSDDMYALADVISSDDDIVRTANLIHRADTPNTVYNNDYLTSNIYSSLHNKDYNRFYFKDLYNENEFRNPALTTQSQSILSQIYMGDKYLLANSAVKPSALYEPVMTKGDITLYKCDSVLPLGYCSSQLLNEETYSEIQYPYSLCALMNSVIVKNGGSDKFECDNIRPVQNFEINGIDGIKKNDNGYSIRLQSTTSFTVSLSEPIASDEIMLISFDVDNDLRSQGLQAGDAKVFIAGIKNNLTDPAWKYYNNNTSFKYVVSPSDDKPLKELEMKFTKGNYDISNIRCYTMKPSMLSNIDRFVFDKNKTKGDNIVGSIDVTKDGYFKLTVPYSEGFTSYVDGVKTKVECVDTAFIGFPLSKGHHEIKITFTAPLKNAGLAMSAAGMIILAVLIIREILDQKCKKKYFMSKTEDHKQEQAAA